MDLEPIVAAARELRRVHEIQCSHFQAPWSHGDMHLDNILYDSTSDRAVLIDFDTRHDSRISPPVRQADDLKVFFLELLARFNEEWAIAAAAFVNEYGAADVLAELTRQLVLPHGFAKILWDTRTFGSSHRLLERRVLELRELVHRFTINPDKAPTATSPYDVP